MSLDTRAARQLIRDYDGNRDALEVTTTLRKTLDALDTAESELRETREALERAEELLRDSRREHYYCEDCWYSCPKAVDGCCDESQGDECNCGADAFNARIDALLSAPSPETP